jgi:hypothetical protein
MIKSQYTPEEEIIKKGIEALNSKLGAVDALRFLALPRRKRMESVLRHREWQKGLEKEEFFNETFQNISVIRK